MLNDFNSTNVYSRTDEVRNKPYGKAGSSLSTTISAVGCKEPGADNGKKKRRSPKRISQVAEARVPVLLEKLEAIGAFDESGRLIQPVIEDFFLKHCTNYRRYRNPVTGMIEETGGKLTGRTLAEALLRDPRSRRKGGRPRLPRRTTMLKRWQDTSPDFHATMILYALKLEGRPHRQLNFHIHEQLASEAQERGVDLQAHLQKLLRERLQRVLGEVEFGLWYRVEQVPFETNSLHAHGLLYIAEADWLKDSSRRNERLRKAIREITCDDGRRGNNWLCLADKQMNAGMVFYAAKGRRDLLRRPLASSPPIELTGHRLESRSHSLSRIGKEFYERVRPFLNAAMFGDLLDWDDAQWEAVGIARDMDIKRLVA